jgi:hypothetical protein
MLQHATILTALASALLLSCKTSCDNEDSSATTITDGTTNESRTSYERRRLGRPFPDIPSPEKVRVRASPFQKTHHDHDLPRIQPCPLTPTGTCQDDPMPSGEVAAGAGDTSAISSITDRSFTIRNNTCETFYLRVTASTDE